MKSKQEWFDNKLKAVPPEIIEEVKLLADIVCRLDHILKEKGITQTRTGQKNGKERGCHITLDYRIPELDTENHF